MIDTSFEVDGLTEGSQYEFRVIAVNSAGSTSLPSDTTGPVTARDEVEPAKVDVDAIYRDTVSVKAGDLFTLQAYISGKPAPTVSWFKDNKEIESRSDMSLQVCSFLDSVFIYQIL